MPRIPIDYANTLMYKIFKPNETDINNIYIGHTTDFRCRKNHHKTECNNPKSYGYNTKKYQFIRNNGGWDCFLMRWIEDYPCNSKREAEKREEELRTELGAKLNERRAFSTPEIAKEYNKQYKKDHPELIKEHNRQYYKENAEELKEQMKQYNKNHAEERKEYNRQYRKDHPELIKEQKKRYNLKKKADKLALQLIA